MSRALGLFLLLAAACYLAACDRSLSAQSPSSCEREGIPPGLPQASGPILDKAVAALEQQTGVRAELIGVRMVEWPDASLGCPEPGKSYPQTVTPGYVIKLCASGKPYEYHADRQGTVVTCANPRPPASGGGINP